MITNQVFASKTKRFVNFMIDYLVKLVLAMILGFFAVFLRDYFGFDGFFLFIQRMNRLQEYLLGIMITFVYYVIIELITFRSIGKYVTKTKVLSEDGGLPDHHQIIIRTLCRLIPFEPFSFLGSNPKGWHDTISKTIVVDIEIYEAKLKK